MAKPDPSNPSGSDVIAQKAREGQKLMKERGTKKGQGLISFEVTTEPIRHQSLQKPSKKTHEPQDQRAPKTRRVATTAGAAPRWKRIAVWTVIIILLLFVFMNNYRKNVYIEELKSANEEFAKAYEKQQVQIAELEARLGGGPSGS